MSISRVYEVVFEKIYEDSTDEEWNQVQPIPAPSPGLVSRHLLHAVTEPRSPEDPAYGYRLDEANPEQHHRRGRVYVHQFDGVEAALQEGTFEKDN